MDFIFSTHKEHATIIRATLMKCGYENNKLTYEGGSPDWGVVIATATPYKQYAPIALNDSTYIVIGDPLLGLSKVTDIDRASVKGARRTMLLGQLWEEGAFERRGLLPHHACALIRIDYKMRNIEIVTDAWAAVPLFYSISRDETVIASSPDLVASVCKSPIDPISCKEYLAAGQIAYPNTLYTDVKQLPPCSCIRISKGRMSSTHWWSPPLPDPTKNLDYWEEAIRDAVIEFMRRICYEHGPLGTTTLSAGLDTRYVVALAAKESLLTLDAITITAAHNLESWVAKQVADRLGIHLLRLTRPRDHYSSILLSKPINIGSQIDWKHAHFHQKVLGEPRHNSFILGGYMADTLYNHGDPFYGARRRAIRTSMLDEDSPRWAVNEIVQQFTRDESEEISERWNRADSQLGISEAHSKNLRNVFPSIRQGHKAHFEAARRGYPMFEPFMTTTSLELGFLIPSELKETGAKSRFFSSSIRELQDIPVNPSKDRDVKKVISDFKAHFPRELWPGCVSHSGPWDEVTGPQRKILTKTVERSRDELSDVLGIDIPLHRDICRLSFQIMCAMEISGFNPTITDG